MMRSLVICLLFVVVTVPVHAAVKTIGQGEAMRLDPAGFPPDMKAAYAVMQAKCTLCHSLERTCVAVTTGIAPISGRPFDRAAASAYGQKMLRKQNARMSKDEVKVIVELLSYLLDTTNSRKQ
jgi:cytochrome c2